ncbi:hypothetical protein Skr01_37240 [Sphaerisporangium krabiense]|nr:hypothetical protein Skr01_37240 [Sphaerisporangium krabiense]
MTDVAAAVAVVGMFWVWPADGGAWPRVVAAATLAAATAGAMTLRWRAPVAATVTAAVATVLGVVLGACEDPMLATAWCLYPLAVERAARARVLVAAPVGVLAALALVTGVPEGDARESGRRLLIAVAALGGAWLLGVTVGRQVAVAREAERAGVRLQVARDVHDVVGHALGVIVARSGVVLALPDADEREVRETLAEVETHARRALEEIQGLVRTLRGGPAPGLGGLPAVIAATRAAGVDVDARVDGRIDGDARIGDGVGAVAFRIVQEALSNVVRHAPGAACAVDVHEEGGTVVVRIRDTGPRDPRYRDTGSRDTGPRGRGAGAGTAGAGVGLRGMRERARLVGGTVAWGARPDGGFEVEARLPVGGAS